MSSKNAAANPAPSPIGCTPENETDENVESPTASKRPQSSSSTPPKLENTSNGSGKSESADAKSTPPPESPSPPFKRSPQGNSSESDQPQPTGSWQSASTKPPEEPSSTRNRPGDSSTTSSNTAGPKPRSPATSTTTQTRALYKSPKSRSEGQQPTKFSSSTTKPCFGLSRSAG